MTPVYVAVLDTRYEVVGVGSTPEEAKAAVGREYRRTNNSGYGFAVDDRGRAVRTDADIEAWFGLTVHGPIPVPGAVTR